MNDPRIITVTIGQRNFKGKTFFFRYGGHNNKLHQWRSKFVFHMFILEYNNKNCMVDSKEHYKSGLGVKGLKINT